MSAKKERVLSALPLIFLATVLMFFFSDITNRPYGNDPESIVKVIHSIEGYENGTIEILEMKDIRDERVAGFLYDNHPAYIQFTKDKKGNYKWTHIEKRMNESFVPFLIHIRDNEWSVLKFMIITNKGNEISKMELELDGKLIEQEYRVHQNSISWIDVPKGKNHEYKYKFFDENGNLIEG